MILFLKTIGNLGLRPGLSSKEATQRQFLVYMGLLMSVGGIVWGVLCLAFGLYFPASIPLGYAFITSINFLVFYLKKNFRFARFVQVLISLALPILFQAILGGFVPSGMVVLWALLALVASISFQNIKSALYWAFAYILALVLLGIFDAQFDKQVLPKAASIFLFVLNGSLISFIIVLLILYFVISRDKAVALIEKQKRETETMLNSVTQGLLLVDQKHCMKEQYSKAVVEITGVSRIAGRPFSEFVLALNPEVSKDAIESFLDLLFKKKLSRKKVAMLNPLSSIVGLAKDGQNKHLEFDFFQVAAQNKIEEVFVAITDKSDEIRYQKELEKQKKKTEERVATISMILNAEPGMVHSFAIEAQEEINAIKDYLRKADRNTPHKEAIATIYRGVHSIKGNAALLSLNELANTAHAIEEKIESLKAKEDIDGSAYLEVLADLTALENTFKEILEILNQIQRFANTNPNTTVENTLKKNLEELVQGLSRDTKTPVELSFVNSLPVEEVPLNTLRTILTQMLRNAVVHGIETKAERLASNKSPQAKLIVRTEKNHAHTALYIQDDGAGLNIEKIRKKAALPPDTPKKEVIQSIFASGMSTKDKADLHAGRGVGLDIVKALVEKQKGKIKIKSSPGQGTTFIIEFPQNSNSL